MGAPSRRPIRETSSRSRSCTVCPRRPAAHRRRRGGRRGVRGKDKDATAEAQAQEAAVRANEAAVRAAQAAVAARRLARRPNRRTRPLRRSPNRSPSPCSSPTTARPHAPAACATRAAASALRSASPGALRRQLRARAALVDVPVPRALRARVPRGGFLFGWWHPGWFVFLTIPLYYWIAHIIENDPNYRANRR
ncbi:MAG: hypothetical protein ACLSVD_09070 [Eggerthellaceae bacterium]